MPDPPTPPLYDHIGFLVQSAAWQNTALEAIMATQAELQQLVTDLKTAQADSRTAILKQIQQLEDALEGQLSSAQMAEVQGVIDAMRADVAQLGADDEPAGPTPPTPPAPTP